MSNAQAVERPKNAEPWTKLGPKVKIASIITIALPSSIFALTLFVTGIDFMAGLLTIFLPLQLLVGALAGFYSFGRRGIMDGLLLVATFFLSLFVLVLLTSVLWSVFEAGFRAMSPHFIYQNNVYVSGQTGLEIGGVGHAILGTIITVGISTIITVPLGVATAVYLTETREKGRGVMELWL